MSEMWLRHDNGWCGGGRRLRGIQGGPMQKCPQCGGEDCTHIVINLKEEDTVQFYACRRCEAKWWEHEGDTIALDEVLNLAAQSEVR